MSADKLKGLGLSSLMVMILMTSAAAKEETISSDSGIETLQPTSDDTAPAKSDEATLNKDIKADEKKATTPKGTIKNALIKGVGYSSGLAASQSSLQSSAEALAKSSSLWLPTLSFDSSASTTFNQVKQPGRVSTLKQQINDAKTGLTLKQNIYSGGDTTARVAGAEAGIKIADATLTQKEIQTLLNSVTAYLDVARDRKLVEIAKKNMENLEKQVEAAKIRYEVGEDTITAVVASESYLAEARAKKIEAEANLTASETTYISTTGELPYIDMEEPAMPSHLLPPTLEEAIKIAMKNNPEVRIQSGKYKAADAETDLAISALLPSLDLQLSGSRDLKSSTYRNFPGSYNKTNTNDATALVQLSVPLDFRGYNQAAVREKKQAAVAQRLTIADTQNAVLGKVNGYWAQLQSYSARIAARKKQVETSEFAVKQVQEEFKVGNKSYTDVLVAEGKDYEARISLVSAERDQIAIAYQLLSMMGTLTIKNLNLGIASTDVNEIEYQAMDQLWGIDIQESKTTAMGGNDPQAVKLMEMEQKQDAENYHA